ncbi:hypothetical protein [Corynebacterium sp. MSK158]|nr:hypothetical protein [Corynebacterium sp. MSK158]MDK8693306.1 hypothetical protein [Corynebacterium sp. MSK158]
MAAHPCGPLGHASYRAPAGVRRHVDWTVVGKDVGKRGNAHRGQ